MADLNDGYTSQVSLQDLAAPTNTPVSFDNFSTSNEEVARAQRLEQAKQDKLDRLSKLNQGASLDDSYTDLGNGMVESNKNKLWNDLSDQEFQSVLQYGLDNYTLSQDEQGNYVYGSGEAYSGPTRRLYMFGTNNGADEVKFGLARGDVAGAEERYEGDGPLGSYGWNPGKYGVNTADKQMDILLPDNVATMLEGLAHGRTTALANRSVKDRYGDPELADAYGSGASEYYSSREGLLGAPTEIDQVVGQELFKQYLTDVQRLRPSKGIVDEEANLARIVRENQEREADRGGFFNRAGNTLAGFGASFVDSLIVSPTAAVGDLTGLYSFGTEEENTQSVNEFFGYNPVQAERAMEEIGKQWEVVADSNATTAERMRAAGNGALEAFITPEMWGTSMGMLASWVTPGAVLKAVGVGSKFANTAKAIDAAAEAGEISKAAARAQKAAAFLSVDGAKAALTAQSGFMVSAMGQVNNQYNEFVENNNGVELEGAEKAKWFAGRFAVQMVNQNLDKLVDFNIIKNPGMIASAIPAVKAMTNREFAQVAKAMATGSVVTATNMGKEAAQEYSQTMMELFNSRYGSEKFKDVEEFTAFLQDERNTTEAGIAALAGAGGAPQFEAMGTVLPAAAEIVGGVSKAGGALGEKIKESRPAPEATITPLPETVVTEEEITPEEAALNVESAAKQAESVVGKYSKMFSDEEFAQVFAAETLEEEEVVDTPSLKAKLAENPSEYRSSIDEIEKAEAVIQARIDAGNSTDTDEISTKVLRKAKREIYQNLMEDEGQPTLGSGISAEDVIEDYLETVDVADGKLVLTAEEEQRLVAYAKANDIPPLRFKNLRKFRTESKDAATVQEEALGTGDRSASSYKNRLRTLVNTPNPSRKAVAGVIDSIDNFLNSQENRKAAFDATLNEVRANLNNYNNQIKEGRVVPQAVKSNFMRGKDVPGYKGAFVAVREAADGTLEIHPESRAVSASIGDTIGYLKRVKTRYGSQVRNILGDEFTPASKGISVRPNSAKQEARDMDQKFYDKRGVTKAIVDDKASKQWAAGGDYSNDNQSIINTGEYTEDDVVVVNSVAKGFKEKSKFRRELAKAYKAGATIVLDREVANNVALQRLVQQYHFKKVTEGDVVKYMTKEKAEPIRAKQAEKKKESKVAERTLKKLVQAIESGDQDTVDKIAEERFDGDAEKVAKFYDNVVNKASDKLTKDLLDTALAKGLNSAELSEVMADAANAAKEGKIPNAAVDKAFAAIEAKIAELEAGEQLLSSWNEAQKEAKKGKLDFAKWLKDNVKNPMQIAKDMLSKAVGEGRKVVYAYYDERKGFILKTNKNQLPEGVVYQELELDPSKYVTVSKTTPLNTFTARELRIAGQDNIAFNQLVDTAVGVLKKTLRAPNLKYKNSNNSIVDLANSPAASLIFDKDLEVNENVAIAAQIALHNFIKNSAYLLNKGKKTKSDIAEILGIDESQLSREAVKMMSDKGMLYKTAANSIGKDIAGMMGLARKSDSEADAQAYDALVADLGQTALLMGVTDGILELDNSLKATEFATTVLQKDTHTVDDGNNAKVIFIQAKKGQEENLKAVAEQAKRIVEAIPDTDVGRKEPSFTKLSDKLKKKVVSKIRKERLGLKVAQPSQKALIELMDTEWSADLDLMNDMIANEELIKARLGYIEIGSADYEKLSFEEKDVQESINRGLDKSFEEMRWLTSSNEGETSVSMWFQYFFSKNGRFFVDSNTINPQTDKHLHRFTVQPKSHINTFTYKNGKFVVGKKDVTANVHYALSQAFGFATDKRDAAKIDAFATKVLKELKTPAAIAKAKQEFLETGEVKSLDIEIEHLGHALQGFKFLEQVAMAKGKPFDSALTAEFDAVTSGFGLKNLQMPIIAGIENWLQKVGVLLGNDEVLSKVNSVSMNNILDEGKVLDSYQTLASDVQQLEFDDMYEELLRMKDQHKSMVLAVGESEYSKKMWEELSRVLPQVEEGKVSSGLRTLFKYPFMTFNYSASIKSIRSNLLTGELLTGIAKQMAAADIKDKDAPIVRLMEAFVGKDGDVGKLQADVRNKPLSQIRSSKAVKSTLEQHLAQMIEASYGAQVEKILTEQFGPFVDAQKNVNGAFKAMFEVFSISFEKKLEEARKKGPVSTATERKIYDDLKAQWPMIRGPLSNMEDELNAGDGIGIYDTQTSSPYGSYAGRKPSRANLSPELEAQLGQKEVRVSQMIKQMAAAIAAGSVVPIHYIDGAIMAQTINGLAEAGIKGITSIHDAIMPSLLAMGEAQKEYNKQVLEVNSSYSFINEIVTTLDRFIDDVPMTDKAYKDRKVKVDDEMMPVKDFLLKARNDIAELANRVNEGRESLYGMLNEGAKIMHMAGTADGVYNVEAGGVTYKPVEKLAPKRYNDSIKVDNVALADVDAMAQNICK